ncbi:DUF1365 domain-containing protein [Tropicibacter naphthalenivorans]|uniref:Cyclopropane-fatty-acyl-phospholipid synthase n=1 Tax=Tropicibacter naphthalenivorans TaxID=441103 RepID=A0A0N7M0A6_9RHOB|nr:DUF1365 domain-containing protein [Tropicibacter naphthalenivorans]CUH79929.1 hypothetical protein TRN7648_02718 [Tropicibacter naphthalenivorans]SMC76185.1 hypothetical protein SAMN04488093_103348 [Tropicibacter naphthalenivorans]
MTQVDLIAGHTYHGRKGAIDNAFRYSVDYVLLDAEGPIEGPSLFSRNRSNFASVQDRDHGGPPKQGRGAPWAREVLASQGVAFDRLRLLTQPRLLGHVFNPVSFWLAYRGTDLMAVIAEVSNTFGDRHSYVCLRGDGAPIQPSDRITAEKIFHVSPFQPIEGTYTFRFDIGTDRVGIWIEYGRENGGLIATLCGARVPLTNRGLLRSALRRPFGARRVLALIHWQALKLWLKGARYRTRPEPPESEVSAAPKISEAS